MTASQNSRSTRTSEGSETAGPSWCRQGCAPVRWCTIGTPTRKLRATSCHGSPAACTSYRSVDMHVTVNGHSEQITCMAANLCQYYMTS